MNAGAKYVKLSGLRQQEKLFLNRGLAGQFGLPRKQTG
jgi:hypothetical protein